jgi:restriction system protein
VAEGEQTLQDKKLKAAERSAREAKRDAAHVVRVSERKVDAQRKTDALEREIEALDSVLADGLRWPAKVEFERLRRSIVVPDLDLGDLASPIVPTPWESIEPPPPGPVARLFGGVRRYEQVRAARRAEYEQYVRGCRDRDRARVEQIADRVREHEAETERVEQEVARHNRLVEELEEGVRRREKASVQDYLERALRLLPVPDEFPRRVQVVVDRGATEAVVRMQLPPRTLLPTLQAYVINERSAQERPVERSDRDVAEQYRDVVGQVVLLALRCLFGSDPEIRVVTLNGHVSAVEPRTGRQTHPCLVTVRVGRKDFLRDENLRAVAVQRCLRQLGAVVSPHPIDYESVQPVLDWT